MIVELALLTVLAFVAGLFIGVGLALYRRNDE